MSYSTSEIEDLSLSLPITQAARRTAQHFADQQPTPQKAEQVRLNTLAVCVVNDYLQMMGIATGLSASDCWNPVVQICADVADLEVTGVGRLECRPMRAHEQTCYIPPEIWSDRIGYVVVQIDDLLREATVLGFAQTVTAENLSVSQLQSLESLLNYLAQAVPSTPSQPITAGKTLVNLSQWLQNLSETGWRTVEALLGTVGTDLAFSFRSRAAPRGTDPSETGVRLAKLIDLGMQLTGNPVALVVELRSEADSSTTLNEKNTNIHLQIHPTGGQTYLPMNLQLIVLDESGAIFLEARARNADNYIQLQFSGEPGERFSVKVALGDNGITEDFVI